MEKKRIFRTNPQKASARVAINSFMIASLFVVLSIILTLGSRSFPPIAMAQLVLAIPFLFVSSLAYAKIGYWNETKLWDMFGWFTNNFGNVFILNAIGLMVAITHKPIAFVYFAITVVLMFFYSFVNVIYAPYLLREKMLKFLLFFIVLFFGGIIPLLIQ